MQNIKLIHEDYKDQLISCDMGIVDNTAILASVEPGKWRRMINGSFYFLCEGLLYLLVMLLVISAIYIYSNWMTFSFNPDSSTRLDVSVHRHDLDSLRNLITGLFVFAALLTACVAMIFRQSRKNLFKLADASTYLEKTLTASKTRREKVISILFELMKAENVGAH